MSPPFTNLDALAVYLRALAAAGSPIVLDTAVLDADAVSQIIAAFELASPLAVNGVTPAGVPDPSGNQLTIAGGAAAALLLASVQVTLVFSLSDTSLEVIVAASMPAGWSFSESFAGLDILPFCQLSLTGPQFVFTTLAQPSYPWPGDGGTGIALAAGQNFLAEAAGFGSFPAVSMLLGPLDSLKLYGPFAPTAGQVLPVGTLIAPSGSGTFDVGSGDSSLSLGSPAVAVRVGTADDLHPVQDVSLLVQGVFQQILQVAVTVPLSGTSYALSTVPLLPGQGSISSLIEALPGGAGFTQYIPSELSDVFSEVGLDCFSMVVDAVSSVTYLGLLISTPQPWPLIPGVLVLEHLQLSIEVVDPAGMSLTQVLIKAQAQLLPQIFPGIFDFTVGLEQQTSWEVSTIGGSYQGVVGLGDIVAGLLGSADSVPAALQGIWFSAFGVTVTPGGPSSYTCYGTAMAAFPVLGSQLCAGLAVEFSETPGGYAVALSGGLAIGEQVFTLGLDLATAGSQLSASWTSTGAPLGLADIADALWLPVPYIPPQLDLALTSASFQYDVTNTVLVLEASSQTYGLAVLAARQSLGAQGWQFFCGIAMPQFGLDLAGLPLLQGVFSGADTVRVGDIQIVVSSVLDAAAAQEINQLVASAGSGYPQVPAAGLAAGAGLSLVVQAGSFTASVSVGTGGGSAGAGGTGGPATAAGGGEGPPEPGGGAGDAAPGAPQATWVTVQRAFGPLQIDRVGVAFTADGDLGLLLDAAFTAGGLTIGLTGAQALLPLTAGRSPSFRLAGLQLGYSGSGLGISGGLLEVPGASSPEYTGELQMTIGSFGATALGSFTEDAEGKVSLFAFAFVDAPLGGPACFFVTGLAGGFGYNRSLELPAVSGVGGYPLVQGAMGILDAARTQAQLDDFIQVAPNQEWLAAGVRFTSFEMVRSFALLTVAFGTNMEIALIGESTLTLPVSTGENPQEPVAEADLLVLADVQVTNGVVAVNGLLSPSSYVFSTAAQLTGGFAFYTWFEPSPYAGDFVVTLGGYNPWFVPQPYYPQVPRLGLNWQVSPELTVKGGLYFALTPSVVMAGGALDATWQSGGIKAWYDARADFLVRWKPFTYQADLSLSIGVSVTIDLLVTSVSLTVQVGVALSLWGPPFGGTATVDLAIVSFTLGFGSASPPGGGNIDWAEFRDSFLPPVRSGGAPTPGDVTPTNSLLTINAPTGILTTFARDGATVWSVTPGALVLVIGTQIPSTAVTVSPPATVASATPWQTALGVGPMGLGAGSLSAALAIQIERDGATDDDDWTAAAVLGSVPAGLWLNTTSAMQTDATVPNALTGITLVPVPPGGEATLPVPIAELLTDDAPVRGFAWSGAAVPRGDSFDQSTAMTQMQSTLVDPAVAQVRTGILAALAGQGLAVAATVDVATFASTAPNLLFSPPTLRTLGEVPDA